MLHGVGFDGLQVILFQVVPLRLFSKELWDTGLARVLAATAEIVRDEDHVACRGGK